MLRIMVTGKPAKFANVKQQEGSKTTAIFYLTEKRWVGGKNVEFVWTCCVPSHKETWARAQTEKGYTVVVEADDIYARVHTEGDLTWVENMIMVTNVTGL